MTFEKVKLRVGEFLVAFGMASLIIISAQAVAERQRAATPAGAWFQLREVYVPDFSLGQNPTVVYDAVVLEEFDAFRIVEVQRLAGSGLWSSVCAGAAVNREDPLQVIENNTVSMDWLLGENACSLVPGRYRLRITVAMVRDGWPAKRSFGISNEFNING